MTKFENVQNELLSKLGYCDLAPFDGEVYVDKYVYLKDGKFCFLDWKAEPSYRALEEIEGNILVKKDDDGYHFCPSHSQKGEPILYYFDNGVKQPTYYILWKNNDYIELSYLFDYHLCSGDAIEYIVTDHYFAIKFHKENNCMIRDENPHLDAIVSKDKNICHLGVITYFIKDIIVVSTQEDSDQEDSVIVYDKEMNVLYESIGEFGLLEKDSKCYLIFPCGRSAFEITKGEIIKLPSGKDDRWNSILIYDDVVNVYKDKGLLVKRKD